MGRLGSCLAVWSVNETSGVLIGHLELWWVVWSADRMSGALLSRLEFCRASRREVFLYSLRRRPMDGYMYNVHVPSGSGRYPRWPVRPSPAQTRAPTQSYMPRPGHVRTAFRGVRVRYWSGRPLSTGGTLYRFTQC